MYYWNWIFLSHEFQNIWMKVYIIHVFIYQLWFYAFSIGTLQTERPDLFYAVPWSYGTLGFLVSAEIKIIPSKKFVRMEYFPVHSKEEMVWKFQEQTLLQDQNEFVETLAYSLDEAVVMTGNLTDEAESDKVVTSVIQKDFICSNFFFSFIFFSFALMFSFVYFFCICLYTIYIGYLVLIWKMFEWL